LKTVNGVGSEEKFGAVAPCLRDNVTPARCFNL